MKVTVGLFFGGKSTEHEVSIITGLQAYSAIDKNKYNVVPIYVTKENSFYIGEKIGKIEEYSDITTLLKKSSQVAVMNVAGRVGLYTLTAKKIDMKKPAAILDCALPAVHGTNVEDGALQGFFETIGLPYAGCGVLSSAIGMDKAVTKAVLRQPQFNVQVLDCVEFFAEQFIKDKNAVIAQITEKLRFPVIIKPVNLGSSIGIKIAKNKEELVGAVEHALLFAERVIAEAAITNLKEINCAVIGDKDSAQASECEEPVSTGGILDFNDKYSGSKGKSTGMASLKRKIPADISDSLREEIRTLAVKAFKALGCSGVARVDFLIDLDNSGDKNTDNKNGVWFNEINTIPGSLAFYLWEPAGISYPALLDKMIALALKREREKANLSFSFESNILSGFKGGKFGSKGG
ncbi:MAG: D-alanine--D-alanine ligase [Oscillospiraceae bacterium]|nr:D-alanine--D-alanine ligase [Oscillospiraceae bacterium]